MALFSGCHSLDDGGIYTVGEENNEIILMAGVRNGGTTVTTRAGVDGNHANHVAFSAQSKIALYIDGVWTGKEIPATYKATTGTITEVKVGDDKHNKVSFSVTEQRYWDDYGTADPENSAGRNKGLTIYAACVEGANDAPAVTVWTSLSWELSANQTSGWSAKDLLVSNNITEANDGTYKFDDWMGTTGTTPSNILEFTHAMTKMTVVLTAGKGFVDGKFATDPSVKLLGFNYTGSVNIINKESSATSSSTTDIDMYLSEGGRSNQKATLTALVFPGNEFSASIADDADKTPTSSTDILELNADGNIYKVTAAQLVKAINSAGTIGTVNGTLEQGKNYILNITVNKTEIEVTATIKAWEDVDTETALPKINVTSTYGYTVVDGGTGISAFTSNYDLFRSIIKATGYDEDGTAAGINPAAKYVSSAWDKTIYWPNHQTHYFFRGVYPQVGTSVSGTNDLTEAEAVTTVSSNDVIAIANATYTATTYPSDLAIAIPRKTDGSFDETCKESGHDATQGICATEGVINLNFEYAMSKVEVRLKSSATDAGHIAMTKDNTKVEIIGGYRKARIKLSDGLHDSYTDADKGNYVLSNLGSPVTSFLVTSLDAVVPQVIGDEVIFRITVTTGDNGTPEDSSDDPTDVYECKVNLINVANSSPATPVKEWVNGKHYIYVLDINKTAIKVTATIIDWIPVTASENVWF